MTSLVEELWEKVQSISNLAVSEEEKIKLTEKEIINSKASVFTFRTLDLKYGLSIYMKRTVVTILEWTKIHNNMNPVIVRLGNGSGKDLLVQKLMLKSLKIEPKYYLVDYSEENNKASAEIDPDPFQSTYIKFDLFKPFSTSFLLSNLAQKIDVVDCQEVLHEIMSKGTGGSYEAMVRLLNEIFLLLKPGGILTIDDVNIVETGSRFLVQFKLSKDYERLFLKFLKFLNMEKKVTKAEENIYECSLRLFSIFCYKVRFANLSSYADLREFEEIHKNMTEKRWFKSLEKAGFEEISSVIIPVLPNLEVELKNNIQMLNKKNWPPFSISIVANKPSSFFV